VTLADLPLGHEGADAVGELIEHIDVIVDVPSWLGTWRPPLPTALRGNTPFIAHAILSMLWQACSTRPSPRAR